MIRFVPKVGSTNGKLGEQLAGGGHVPEGDWLVADRQSAGRGRSGRDWQDGTGNFMGSTVVHLRFGDPAAPTLALVAGLAVHAVVTGYLSTATSLGLSDVGSGIPTLKWPNDLLVGHAKLAGILLESERDAVIVGIGVNLAQSPVVPGRESTSLALLGIHAERDRFAHDLAQQFDLDLQRWRDFGLAPIVRRWLAAAHAIGTPLRADTAEGGTEGTFAGLADDGGLRLQLANGSVRIVHTGEVRLLDEVGG